MKMLNLSFLQEWILLLLGCDFITYPVDDQTVAVKWVCR